jgi:hypothetical protein
VRWKEKRERDAKIENKKEETRRKDETSSEEGSFS